MNAQEIWESDRAHIRKEMDAEITKRKIRKISFIHDGKLLLAEVGKPNPYNEGQLVKVIYEDGGRGTYLICDGDSIGIAPRDSLVEEF